VTMRGGAKGPLVLEQASHEIHVVDAGSRFKVVDARNHAIGTKQIISKSREIAFFSDALSYLIERVALRRRPKLLPAERRGRALGTRPWAATS
jgi:hypothetical protein